MKDRGNISKSQFLNMEQVHFNVDIHFHNNYYQKQPKNV